MAVELVAGRLARAGGQGEAAPALGTVG